MDVSGEPSTAVAQAPTTDATRGGDAGMTSEAPLGVPLIRYRSYLDRPQRVVTNITSILAAVVIAGIGLVVNVSLRERVIDAMPAVSVLVAIAVAAAVLAAHQLRLRARIAHDDRLAWVSSGFAVAALAAAENALSLSSFTPRGSYLDLTADAAAVTYIVLQMSVPLFAVGGLLGWSSRVRRGLVGGAAAVLVAVALRGHVLAGVFVSSSGHYSAAYRVVLWALVVLTIGAAAAWVARTRHRPTWPEVWTTVCLGLLAANVLLNVTAELYLGPVWLASITVRMFAFVVPAAGLLKDSADVTTALADSEQRFVERLNREVELAYRGAGDDRATRQEREEFHRRVQDLIASGGPAIVLQPIFDLTTGRLAGAEALSRFPFEPQQPPNVWFDRAWSAGCGVQLEVAALRAALLHLDAMPSDGYLSVNVSPQTLTSRALPDELADDYGGRLLLEITEHAQVDNYLMLIEAQNALSARGVRFAVDDAGAGFASLRHIIRVAPDVIKLDVSLVRDIDVDPVRASLAAALVTFGRDNGVRIVAEGVETDGELLALRGLNVDYAQGYRLARPAPPPIDADQSVELPGVAPATVDARSAE